jgi:hypothetical protein
MDVFEADNGLHDARKFLPLERIQLDSISILKYVIERLIATPFHAEVAELVDALGSGSSGRTPVGVRVPASAPAKTRG